MTDELLNRGDQTRAEIVSAAHRLFLECGYHGTSMRAIAQLAEIALGGIYNHFGSKEEVFLAVISEYHPFNEVLPAMKAAEGQTVAEFARDAARRMVVEIGNRRDFLNLVFIELVEFKSQHIPQLFDSYYPEIIAFAQRFTQLDGELRNVPLLVIGRSFLGLFFSYVMTDLLMGPQLSPELREKSLDYFVDIYLHGILADPINLE